MAKNKEELKAVLIAQEIYMPDGAPPNTTKLNIISGAVIPPLMEAIKQIICSLQPEGRSAPISNPG